MYQRTYWKDHVTDPSSCYHINKTPDTEADVYTIIPAGNVMEYGTPQDQEHFNNLETGVLDNQIALAILLNHARQNAFVLETGVIELKNTGIYPYNNSKQSIEMKNGRENTDYIVLTEVKAFVGNVGEVEISDKLNNGFKIGYTGSAPSATVKYTIIGGYLK